MKTYNISVITMIFLGFGVANGDSFVNIPCPKYEKGVTWKIHMTSSYLQSDIKTIVKSVDNKKIILVDTTKSTTKYGGGISSSTRILKKEANTVYMVESTTHSNGMDNKNIFVPPIPICGKVPKKFNYTTLNKNSYSSTKTKTAVSIRKVGKKKIKVPTGEFDTLVYAKHSQTKMVDIPNSAKTKISMIMYYVKDIGIIKYDMISMTSMPKIMINNKAFPKQTRSKIITELISYKGTSNNETVQNFVSPDS